MFYNGFTSFFHDCVHYGHSIFCFLKPFDFEFVVFGKLKFFFFNWKFYLIPSSVIFLSVYQGFDILDWNFKLTADLEILCIPSNFSYKFFLKRVKHIVNNSNYGALRRN